jgi:predicted dienelactone hydrolase
MNGRTALLICVAVAALVLPAGSSAGGDDDVRVGHEIRTIGVPGVSTRVVDVHLWYPADEHEYSEAPKTVYKSALYGVQLLPTWNPLAWTIDARIARDAPLDGKAKQLPVIVFSHGNQNDPIDYAYTLERLAAAGFVVAAPAHAYNTGDDLRRDFVNKQAGFTLLPCQGTLLPPCSKTDARQSMIDRVQDVRAVLDALPSWYGDRVDVSRVGVFGHSRGTVTALMAAGGSTPLWNIKPVPQVAAVVGMAIGTQAITNNVNQTNVSVPMRLVAGLRDLTSPPAVSENAVLLGTNPDKKYVPIADATHRSFDSTYCAQMQAAGAVVVAPGGERAQLDLHTLAGDPTAPLGILTHPTSGKAMDYCSLRAFKEPVDIRSLVESITGSPMPKVPTTGLDTDAVMRTVTKLAVPFFRRVLTCEECEDED